MSAISMKTSILIRIFKKLSLLRCSIRGGLDKIYLNSRICSLIVVFREVVTVNFRYSLLGKITELREEDSRGILENSRFIRRLTHLYKACKEKALIYEKTSATLELAKETGKELHFLSVKKFSVIAVIAILTNSIFSIFADKEMGLLGWTTRGALLFAGISGIFCNVGWQAIIDNSMFLILIRKKIR